MKKFVAVLLMLMLAFGSVSYAITFKDVAASFWGYAFINEVAEKGIVTGYSDGTFQPDASISKYASVVMIYRALKVSNLIPTTSLAAYRTKHAVSLTTYEVPDWTDLRDAVAYFLEVGVLSTADLKNFTDLGKLQNASRQDVSIFLGRALNLHLKVATTQINSLSFKDAALISNAATPYVSILNSKQIVTGDTAGYFKPHDPVTRAQMAKMISLSLKTLTDYGQTSEQMAVVSLVLKDTQRVVFKNQVTNADIIEKIESTVKIMSGTTQKSFNDLQTGQVVKLVYQGQTLSRIEMTVSQENILGEITGVIPLADRTILSINTATDIKSYIITSATPVTQNGLMDHYLNLQVGYQVTMTVNGDTVIKIDYQKASSSYDGIVTQAVTVTTVPIIKIRVGTEEKTFEFTDNVVIKRNSSKVSMADLKAGDVVTFKVSLGKITEIEAISTKTSVSGTINTISYSSSGTTLKIETSAGVIETYNVSNNATVKLDGETASQQDLRADYAITAKLESNQIISIVAETYAKSNFVVGRVVKIFDDLNVFTIKDSAGDIYTIYVQEETLFITRKGIVDDFGMLSEDDYVFAYGALPGEKMLQATKVLELE